MMKKVFLFFLTGFALLNTGFSQNIAFKDSITNILKDSILLFANQYVQEKPVTITSSYCSRSKGGIHDYYSEGRYWWTNPDNPDGPYIRRDGLSNPDRFSKHHKMVQKFSSITGNLTSAFLITGNKKYADAVVKHLHAWFVDTATLMNPDLHYSQAIKGICEGRYIGIIDGIQLMEVAQSVNVLQKYQIIDPGELKIIKKWFADFLVWLTTSDYGKEEKAHPNNHGTWWNAQTATYARLVGNDKVLKECRNNYTTHLLPNQLAANGSFPEELARTKPYNYSLYNLNAMVMNTMILSDQHNDLWDFTTHDGKNLKKALTFMVPYFKDKNSWPYSKDIRHWDDRHVGPPSLAFASIHFKNKNWFEIWKSFPHFVPQDKRKLIRGVPIRNPMIWLEFLD